MVLHPYRIRKILPHRVVSQARPMQGPRNGQPHNHRQPLRHQHLHKVVLQRPQLLLALYVPPQKPPRQRRKPRPRHQRARRGHRRHRRRLHRRDHPAVPPRAVHPEDERAEVRDDAEEREAQRGDPAEVGVELGGAAEAEADDGGFFFGGEVGGALVEVGGVEDEGGCGGDDGGGGEEELGGEDGGREERRLDFLLKEIAQRGVHVERSDHCSEPSDEADWLAEADVGQPKRRSLVHVTQKHARQHDTQEYSIREDRK
mmetsp:Transcript_15128/g.38738  ORF Transcript_15128/g.38738 Transcript_15128/m.38738 type:complete len:258 (+) Transcript_15128:339-1112(+)